MSVHSLIQSAEAGMKSAKKSKVVTQGNPRAGGVDPKAAPFRGRTEHSGQGAIRAKAGSGVKKGKYM